MGEKMSWMAQKEISVIERSEILNLSLILKKKKKKNLLIKKMGNNLLKTWGEKFF